MSIITTEDFLIDLTKSYVPLILDINTFFLQ